MGPIFNPVYWVLGCLFLLAAVVLALAGGAGIYPLLRRFDTQDAPQRGKGLAALAGILVFVIAFCGLCAWSFSNPSEVATKPAINEIVGTWSPTPVSIQRMQQEGGYQISQHTLTFAADGSFVLTNMPDWWNNFGHSSQRFYSGSGTWQLSKGQLGWQINVIFTSSAQGLQGQYTFYLSGPHPPYQIYFFLGDPDAGEVMSFERSQ